jgi:phage gpG-like protein
MSEISLKITGIEQALAQLSRLQQRAATVTTALARDTGLVIQGEVDEIFNSAPGSGGGSVAEGVTWPALTEAYLKRRPDRRSGQILRDTGELLNSLTVGGAGNILQVDADSLTFGSALPKSGRLNRDRQYLFITNSMTAAVTRLWEKHVTS